MILIGLTGGITGGIAVVATPVLAQSLQQNTNNNLQPQTAPGQNSVNTQSQTGTLQKNNGSSVLNQNGSQPLGVVSSPNQTRPDAVASPSPTLKTDITKADKSNKMPVILAIGALAIILVGLYIARRKPPSETKDTFVNQKPVIAPVPVIAVKKTRQPRKNKKKKKTKQR